MKKFLLWLIAILGVLLGLGLIGLRFRNSNLKRDLEKSIHASTGLRVEIEKFKRGLRTTAIQMQGFKLYNRPEFGNSVLLDVPDLLVEFDPELASQGKLRFKQLRVNIAELNVIRDAAGQWNIEKVEKEMTENNTARTKRKKPRLEFAGIDELRFTIGRINYTDMQKPSRSRQINVNLRDELVQGINTDEDLQDWIGNFIFKVILQEAAAPEAR